jgi:hypothetical protein
VVDGRRIMSFSCLVNFSAVSGIRQCFFLFFTTTGCGPFCSSGCLIFFSLFSYLAAWRVMEIPFRHLVDLLFLWTDVYILFLWRVGFYRHHPRKRGTGWSWERHPPSRPDGISNERKTMALSRAMQRQPVVGQRDIRDG